MPSNGYSVEDRLRRFLLYVAGFVWAGSIVELFLAEHTEDWIQYIPFVVCVFGVLAIGFALLRPGVLSFKSLRVVSVIAFLASLLGAYKHLEANYEFEREINVADGVLTSMWEALFGVGPLLAPGILTLAAILAWAATWKHPVWAKG